MPKPNPEGRFLRADSQVPISKRRFQMAFFHFRNGVFSSAAIPLP
jgi:hypothetical protein